MTTKRVKTITGWATYEVAELVDPHPGRADYEVLEEAPCGRCGGRGVIAQYRHIAGGECFECDGDVAYRTRFTVGDSRRAAEAEVRGENNARRFAVRTAALFEYRPAWREVQGHPVVSSFVERIGTGKGLTEAQIDLGDKIAAEAADRAAKAAARSAAREAEHEAAEPVPSGRVTVSGVIVSTKEVAGFQGSTSLKMLVKDDRGFKVFGSVPSSLTARLTGRRVTFTATLEASADDAKFGFFKRPTKAAFAD